MTAECEGEGVFLTFPAASWPSCCSFFSLRMKEAKRRCSCFEPVADSGGWAWSGEPRPVLLPGVETGAGVPGAVVTFGTASKSADWSYVVPRR